MEDALIESNASNKQLSLTTEQLNNFVEGFEAGFIRLFVLFFQITNMFYFV
jgi:hypothetical protein